MATNTPQTVLIIEDDPIIRNILQTNLTSQGYQVLAAEDGLKGVQTAKEAQPGIILMDIRLPNITGWEATRRLKLEPKTARIPIIVLTAQSTSQDLQYCFESGCDAFMTKPIQFAQLFTKIEMLLNRSFDHPPVAK